MYCANCGVKLDDSLAACPLCGTRAYHPDLERKLTEGQYPGNKFPAKAKRSLFGQIFLTILVLIPLLIVPLCDFQITNRITWSGYVIGAILFGYVVMILPTWFQKPNMVIFTPCNFAAAAVYLFYINRVTGGDWFWGFALPVTVGIGIIVTTVVVLAKYVPKGNLYTFGGALIASGGFMVLMEWLIIRTFHIAKFIGWSLYPLITLVILGGFLIFLAICRPARETLERKFFL